MFNTTIYEYTVIMQCYASYMEYKVKWIIPYDTLIWIIPYDTCLKNLMQSDAMAQGAGDEGIKYEKHLSQKK